MKRQIKWQYEHHLLDQSFERKKHDNVIILVHCEIK